MSGGKQRLGRPYVPKAWCRCRAVIRALAPSVRYLARTLSAAVTRSPLIWLIAAVRALTADVRAARRTRRHSTGPSLAFGIAVVRPSSID